MKHLSKYLDQQNFWRAHQKKPLLTVATLTRQQADTIMSSLESSLSPENLSCDGELSRSEQNQRFRLYTGAMKELNSLFPMVLPEYDEYEIFK
jgi:hypothetical protein